MADNLDLLFKIRGDSSGAKSAAADAKAAVAGLKGEFSNLASTLPGLNGAFANTTLNLTRLAQTAPGVSSGLAGIAGPAGAAVVGLAALVAGAFAVSQAFLGLVVSTVKWQDELDDLSAATGVSVETLSALQAIAKSTGGSIEQLSASLVIFQTNMEKAQDPASEMAATFAKLGIETDNTEEAFRQAVTALGNMEEGFHQTATARELFGRSGVSVLAIIKETNGNLDEAIAKLSEMGLVLSKDAAKGASEFDKQMGLLELQIRATTAALVQDSIPHITAALKQLSDALKDNKDAITALGFAVGVTVKPQLDALVTVIRALEGATIILNNAWLLLRATFEKGIQGRIAIITRFTELRQSADTLGTLGAAVGGAKGDSMFGGVAVGISQPTRGGGGGGGGGGRSAGLSEADKLNKEIQAAWLRDMADQSAEAVKILTDSMNEMQASLDKATDSLKDNADRRKDLEDRVSEAIRRQRNALSELQGFEKSHSTIIQEYIQQTIKEAEATGGLTDELKKQLEVLREIGRQMDLIEEKRTRFEGVEGEAEGSSTKPVKDTRSEIDKLFDHVNDNLSGAKQTAAMAGLEAMTGAFQGLGEAVGQAAYAWVLYGNAGVSIRQVTAQILASLAQQAAVKAVFELAEGFAALFLHPPAAAAHFQAAAIYGSVAGIAAVAGRAIAGDSFAPQGAVNSGGGGGSRSGGGGGGSQNPSPIVLGSQRQVVEHIVTVKAERGFVTSHLVRELDSNNPELNRVLRRERG